MWSTASLSSTTRVRLLANLAGHATAAIPRRALLLHGHNVLYAVETEGLSAGPSLIAGGGASASSGPFSNNAAYRQQVLLPSQRILTSSREQKSGQSWMISAVVAAGAASALAASSNYAAVHCQPPHTGTSSASSRDADLAIFDNAVEHARPEPEPLPSAAQKRRRTGTKKRKPPQRRANQNPTTGRGKKEVKEDTRAGKDVLALQQYLGAAAKLGGNTDGIYRSKMVDYYEWARKTYRAPECAAYGRQEAGGVWALDVAPPVTLPIYQQYMEDTFLHAGEERESKDRPSDSPETVRQHAGAIITFWEWKHNAYKKKLGTQNVSEEYMPKPPDRSKGSRDYQALEMIKALIADERDKRKRSKPHDTQAELPSNSYTDEDVARIVKYFLVDAHTDKFVKKKRDGRKGFLNLKEWSKDDYAGHGIREIWDFTFGDCSLVRSQNKRTMNLDHMFAEEITIPNEDVECGDECFPVHQCNRQKMRVICVCMPETKTDKTNMQIASIAEHKYPQICPVFWMAAYFFHRFHCLGEKLPDVTKGKDEWYKIPVARGKEEGRAKKKVKKGDPEEVHELFHRLQYSDQLNAIATAFEDLMIPTDKKTQASRGCGARRLRFKGAAEAAIAKFGCWLGIISKCAMQKYYMTDVDWKLLALQAGFNKPAKYQLIRCF